MKLQTSQTSLFPPLNPPLQPQQAVGATGPQMTEANRLHLELKQTFQTYQAVDQALRNLILAAVPPVYVNSLSHDITGFGNVSALTIIPSGNDTAQSRRPNSPRISPA